MNPLPFTLFLSLRSPFARRIRLALHRLNLAHEIVVVDVFEKNEALWAANPLGTVPTLVTAEGTCISDSDHLLDFLHEKTGKIWPESFAERTHQRQASVWCAGIMQSSVLYFQETKMHEVPSERWQTEHWNSIQDTLSHLNKLEKSTWAKNEKLTQSGYDLAVALQYLSIRIPELNAFEKFPEAKLILNLALNEKAFIESQPPPA